MYINKLENELKNSNAAYASGMPFLTDEEYDIIWQQLYALDPYNKNLYHTARDPKLPNNQRPHRHRIKGTQKAFNQKDLLPFMQRFGDTELILEPKYDGCAAVLYRQQRGKYLLILEGDGDKGRDITHLLKHMILTFTPSSMESVELIIPIANWKESFGANPRNAVAGWIARKESFPHALVDIVSHNHGKLKQSYSFNGDFDSLSTLLLELHTTWKEIYPIDGIMIKVADKKLRLTSDTHDTVYNWSLAWKPPIQTKETVITDIEWNVSRQGRVIPTVIYEPIKLCGTMNSRVTANNATWIKEKEITINDKIIVGKAGEIIPKIIDVIHIKKEMKDIISLCPVCTSSLQWEGKHLVCNNPKCIAQLIKSLHYFYSDKGMDLKSIGEFMLGDLLEDKELYNILKDHPYALLDPIYYEIINKIKSIWGEARTTTYLDNIEEINNTKNYCHFIAALGYKGLAYKTALKIANYITHGIYKTHIQQNAVINYIEGFKIFNNLLLPNFSFIPLPPKPKIMYCITGTLESSRNDLISYLEKYGWQFSNQVSKFVNYLIIGEKPGKIKQIKAKELNTTIINEEELMKLLSKEKTNAT